MWKLSRLVDRIWWQKSRLKWQLQGDKNSKFFHYMVSSRQRRNNINTIMVNDEQIEDPKLIKKATFNHFKSLYEEEMVTRPFFTENQGNSISEELAGQLVGAFTENEVWCCIKSCDGNKAPGLDGFNMQSIKKGWGFMKKDILDFMGEFHNNCKLPKCLNSSFITLIPKIENPMALSDYRPISLIGSMYKILAKVLAARLKKIILVVVGEVQSAFIGGEIFKMEF